MAVHIRSLHDPWTSHPDAVLPLLHTAHSLLMFTELSGVQIHDRIVSWVQTSYEPGLVSQIEVWDWQAGCMIWVRLSLSGLSILRLSMACTPLASSVWMGGLLHASGCCPRSRHMQRVGRPPRLSVRSSVLSYNGRSKDESATKESSSWLSPPPYGV